MTDAQSTRAPEGGHAKGWPTAVASLSSRHGVFRAVVLAAAGMARFPRGNGRCGTLAMAGCASVGARILRSSALHLGLRVDGARHPCPGRSAAATGGSGFLSLRAEPHVRGLRSGLDRAVGCVWTSRPGSDRFGDSRCHRRSPVRGLLRRTNPAREIRRTITKSIAATCVAGGHVHEPGTSRNSRGAGCFRHTLLHAYSLSTVSFPVG